MWRLGQELAVRMPRTPGAPSRLCVEQQWLPVLAPTLPLPVPVPVRVGESSPRFPDTWSIARWVDGDPADSAPITSPQAAGVLAGAARLWELCAGDPATDLAAAWVLLPADTASRFFDAYAKADNATIRRARGWAVLRAFVLIRIGMNGEQGLPGGKPTWLPAGWSALERVLASKAGT
jgi:aminoglycoside phosphotransferase (APT) family kinase protein